MSKELQERPSGPVETILNGMLGVMLIFAGGVGFGRAQALGPLPEKRVPVPVVQHRFVPKIETPRERMHRLVREISAKHGFPAPWALALIDQENSDWNPKAINKNPHITKGMAQTRAAEFYDYGLMQVHGQTARGYGVKNLTSLLEPEKGLDVGLRYASDCKRTAEGLSKREGVVRRLTFACFHRGQSKEKFLDVKGLKYAAIAERLYQKRVG